MPGERRAQPPRPPGSAPARPSSVWAGGGGCGSPRPSPVRGSAAERSPSPARGCGAGRAAARCRGPAGVPTAAGPAPAPTSPGAARALGEPRGGPQSEGGAGRRCPVPGASRSEKRSLRSRRGARLPTPRRTHPPGLAREKCEGVNRARSPPKPYRHKQANSAAENTTAFLPSWCAALPPPPCCLGLRLARFLFLFRSHRWGARACLGVAVRTWPSHSPYLRGQGPTREGPVTPTALRSFGVIVTLPPQIPLGLPADKGRAPHPLSKQHPHQPFLITN